MKKYRILIPGIADFENRGGMAIILGLINCLKNAMPDIEITLLSRHPKAHRKYECFGIVIEQYPWLRERTGLKGIIDYLLLMTFDLLSCWFLRIIGKIIRSVKYRYDKYNIAIPIVVDGFSDDDHGSIHVIKGLVQEFFSQTIIAKPRAIIPTDLGPFNSRITKWLAKIVFNRVKILALRENASYTYALALGLNKPQICNSADIAFLMDPISQEQAMNILLKEGFTVNNKPLIGITPSSEQEKKCRFPDIANEIVKQQKYVDILAETIDTLIEQLGATVCIIPHVFPCDNELSQKIYTKVRNKHNTIQLQGEYLANELKGIIGMCDLFIGGRMHATIAATSMKVPTVALATKDKFHRLIGDKMGQQRYVIDILNLDSTEMLTKLNATIFDLWVNRFKVSKELQQKTVIARDKAFSFGTLVKELLDGQ